MTTNNRTLRIQVDPRTAHVIYHASLEALTTAERFIGFALWDRRRNTPTKSGELAAHSAAISLDLFKLSRQIKDADLRQHARAGRRRRTNNHLTA